MSLRLFFVGLLILVPAGVWGKTIAVIGDERGSLNANARLLP